MLHLPMGAMGEVEVEVEVEAGLALGGVAAAFCNYSYNANI